jgi:hypothetical protein
VLVHFLQALLSMFLRWLYPLPVTGTPPAAKPAILRNTANRPVRAGSQVVLVDDPLKHGVGQISAVRKDGKLDVEWLYDEYLIDPPVMAYAPFDLEELDVWLAREHNVSELDESWLARRDKPRS